MLYLKDMKGSGKSAPAPQPENSAVMQTGQAIYLDNCAARHVSNGAGAAPIFPALKGNAIVQSDNPATLYRVALGGAKAVATAHAPTAPAMPAFNRKL